MEETKTRISNEVIEDFLKGTDPQKHIIAIESYYDRPSVTLIINDTLVGGSKRMEECGFKPFLWFKEDVTTRLYNGKRLKIIEECAKYGIKIKKLRVSNDSGDVPERMENGYKYLATSSKSYNHLVNFFKYGGIEIFHKDNIRDFVMFNPTEQFLIQTGKRLFKGMDDYDDLHRFQFDLETEGLFASKNPIFQIGVRDNRGLEGLLEVDGENGIERRNAERVAIEKFFKIIDMVQPDVITGYNSENFDWPYLFERAERLSIPITELAITLNRATKIKRKPATLKLGSETEPYEQTHMFGYNIIDISHSVRRAMAINSEIKSWGLKYITQYSEIAKENRVYVPGDKINTIWADKLNEYAFNDKNGDWYKITENKKLKVNYKIVKGNFIVQRYLCDDLWETEQIDNIFNQASFLISKIIPTSFQRSSTMGTAGQWKLIMAAWSYENGLAIPETQSKRDFVGGLSRLLEVGYAKGVIKLDYAGLYPKTQLTHGIFPLLDISGVMEGMLSYVVDTRDKFKNLNGKEKKKYKGLEKKLKEDKSLSEEQIKEITEAIRESKALANVYDKKQLPLKILANSWFGSYGAPYIFNWGDTDSAEETTCRGRQYLRFMVKFFTEKYGFKPLVGDSVTFDTPVYIKGKNNLLNIVPICDLFDNNSGYIDLDGLRDYATKPYEVLTVNGWKNVNYIYRHGTDKKIHSVTTKNRLINVTEDHSLFQNSIQVKPSSLKRGDVIDVYTKIDKFNSLNYLNYNKSWLLGVFLNNGSVKVEKTSGDWRVSNNNLVFLEKLNKILINDYNVVGIIENHLNSSGVYTLVVNDVSFATTFHNNFYTSYGEKKVPMFILNSDVSIKKYFFDGMCGSNGYGDSSETISDIGMTSQVAMAGLSFILNELGIEYKLKTRKDNFISFKLENTNCNNSNFTDKTLMKSGEVWLNEIIDNKDKDNFVYDISTEDGTFIGGVGMVNLKNTDGFNFSVPENIDEIKYHIKGTHWKTEEDAGKDAIGVDAVLGEFNETFMMGRMGLDIDDYCNSTINFSRKNYANDIGGKVKLVGNSIKSKRMPVYIEDFIGKSIRMLLDADGYSFINYYYEYVDKIYNYQIPLVKIASKGRVKLTIADYKKKAFLKNKAGNPLPKQAHMELAVRSGLEVTLGDILYYINIGKSKSTGDLKTVDVNKMTKKQSEKWKLENEGIPLPPVKKEVQLNSKLIDTSIVERDFELIKELEMIKKVITKIKNKTIGDDEDRSIETLEKRVEEIDLQLFTDEYNVARYLDAFNKKVKPLLVCFEPEVRDKVLLGVVKVKNKETKEVVEKLKERTIFTKLECGLISGKPFKTIDQDSYENLMIMEDREIKFWDKVDKLPNNMEEDEWSVIRTDYHERLVNQRLEGIEQEKERMEDIIRHLEVSDLKLAMEGTLPVDVFILADIADDDSFALVSRKWDVILCYFNDIFKYEQDAISRKIYYENTGNKDSFTRYDEWLSYLSECIAFTGSTVSVSFSEIYSDKKIDSIMERAKENSLNTILNQQQIDTNKKISLSEDEEQDNELKVDENGNLIRTDENIILDDGFDDTFGDVPDDYTIEKIKEEETKPIIVEIEDEWGF